MKALVIWELKKIFQPWFIAAILATFFIPLLFSWFTLNHNPTFMTSEYAALQLVNFSDEGMNAEALRAAFEKQKESLNPLVEEDLKRISANLGGSRGDPAGASNLSESLGSSVSSGTLGSPGASSLSGSPSASDSSFAASFATSMPHASVMKELADSYLKSQQPIVHASISQAPALLTLRECMASSFNISCLLVALAISTRVFCSAQPSQSNRAFHVYPSSLGMSSAVQLACVLASATLLTLLCYGAFTLILLVQQNGLGSLSYPVLLFRNGGSHDPCVTTLGNQLALFYLYNLALMFLITSCVFVVSRFLDAVLPYFIFPFAVSSFKGVTNLGSSFASENQLLKVPDNVLSYLSGDFLSPNHLLQGTDLSLYASLSSPPLVACGCAIALIICGFIAQKFKRTW